MILLLVLQITAAIDAYHQTDYQQAYHIAREVQIDDLDGFGRCEVLELQAYTATAVREFVEADSLFQIVFQCEYDSILRKAYTNYADLQYRQFNFDQRLEYLQKAYDIEPTAQLIRIIARHHIEIRADYETAEIWMGRHESQTGKDRAGFDLLMAEFNESRRQYDRAIEYYSRAMQEARQANLFDYELFAAEGLYRSQRLHDAGQQDNVVKMIVWFIIGTGMYYIFKRKFYATTD